jgi:hypothetical protein
MHEFAPIPVLQSNEGWKDVEIRENGEQLVAVMVL